MSSSEQASEPTMDEILASIRKIISDDEPGETPQPDVASSMPEPGAPAEPATPAEDGLAEDLVNALNDSQVGAEAGAEEVDDILDLTQIVEEQLQAPEAQVEAPQMEVPQVDALQAALGDAVEAPVSAPPQPTPAPQEAPGVPDESVGDADIASLLTEAGVQDTVSDIPAEAQAPAGDNPVAAQGEGDEPAAPLAEDALISEALSAMEPQAGEPVAEAAPQPGTSAPEATEQPAVPEVTEAEAETPAQEDASFETGDEMTAEAPAQEDAAALDAVVDDAAPAEDSAPAEEQAMGEAAYAAPAGGAGKTLEDSVKDLLRPMLREWLDDNMERIVKDEVASENIKGQDS